MKDIFFANCVGMYLVRGNALVCTLSGEMRMTKFLPYFISPDSYFPPTYFPRQPFFPNLVPPLPPPI